MNPGINEQVERFADQLDNLTDEHLTEPVAGTWTYLVRVSGCTADDAERVISERLSYSEDLGFDYELHWAYLAGGD